MTSKESQSAANAKYRQTHKEARRAYSAKYRQTHKESCRASAAKYYQTHKEAQSARGAKYRNTPRGYLNDKYTAMKDRVTNKKHPYRHLYGGLGLMPRPEFLAWALANNAFIRLWAAWQVAGRCQKLAPSIDRIDTQRGYVRGNVQFLTLSANSRKANLWQHYGLNPITKAAA